MQPALLLAFLAPALSGQHVTEESKLVGSNASPGDEAGLSLAVHADTTVVGAHLADQPAGQDEGAAYVWVRSGLVWSEQAVLVASDAAENDNLGWSVALDGDTIVVGSPRADRGVIGNAGAAYVFTRNGTTWVEEAKLSSGAPSHGHMFGSSVAISGDTIVVGETQDGASIGPGPGAAFVFVRTGTTWSQQARLDMALPKPGSAFGFSAAIEGDRIVVGADRDDVGGNAVGTAHVFLRTGTTWGFQSRLMASDAAVNNHFGWSVAISGDTVAVGATLANLGAGLTDAGAAYVFRRSGGLWSEEAKLTASDASAGDYFGISVALEGDQVVCGASGADIKSFGQSEGSAYVFERTGSVWSEVAKLVAKDGSFQSRLGTSASRHGDTLVLGARFDASSTGAGYVFRFSEVESYCTAGISASGCSALLAAAGTPSASAPSGFTLSASAVEGSKGGLFFTSTNGRQASPWGNGSSLQCVTPPVKRAGLLTGVGTNGQCDGAFLQDLNSLWSAQPPKNPGAGATVQAQLWYRDPTSTSNRTTSLSDALEFVVKP
jgi:hypothetical protein